MKKSNNKGFECSIRKCYINITVSEDTQYDYNLSESESHICEDALEITTNEGISFVIILSDIKWDTDVEDSTYGGYTLTDYAKYLDKHGIYVESYGYYGN